MKEYTIRMPVRPHIHKYLISEFGEPYVLSENDFIGPMILQFLRKPEYRDSRLESVQRMSDLWLVKVPFTMFHDRQACHIGSRNIITFNTCIDQLMKYVLHQRVLQYVSRGEQQKTAIYDFMHQYQISENDLSFDGWKKAIQRRVKKNNQQILRKSSVQLSPEKCV